MNAIDPDTTRRLAFIRLLVARAIEVSREPAPFSFDSINRLHDATETFLALAAQVHSVQLPKEFSGYWSNLAPILGRPLGNQASMQKFNKVRVSLKHYGVEPSEAEILSARVLVPSFLSDECFDLFGLRLEDVSLLDFVQCEDARSLLQSAQRRWAIGDADEAMADLVDAFETLIRDYEDRKMVGYSNSVFDFAKTFQSPFSRSVNDHNQRQFEEAIIDSIKSLDFAVMLLGFGVDFRRYGKFRALTPKLVRNIRGNRIVDARRAPTPTSGEYEFCFDFIVQVAIQLADFDYDTDWSVANATRIAKGPA